MTNLAINIRVGEKKDIPQLLALIKELAEYERATHEVENTEETLLQDGFGESPLFGFYVSEVNHEIVGMALYYWRYSTWKGKVMYLEDLYIQPDFRRYKIGQAFFKVLVQKAKAEKCSRISWQVLEWNTPAIDFYKKIGASLDPEWVNGFLLSTQFDDFLEKF